MPRRPSAVLAVMLAAAGGCSSLGTVFLSDRLAPDMPCIPRIYGGVAADVAMLRSDMAEKELVLLDLPFSLVADTLFLPYTIYAQIRYGNLCPQPLAGSQGEPVPPDPAGQPDAP
jgi:uncharacterized protein YceK